MIFDYIALNKSNNKVQGEVVAESLEDARGRLHGMGLIVLAVNERKETEQKKIDTLAGTKKDYFSFEFQGIDQKGKEIVGTIDAKDAFSAYIRLKNEFFFDVRYIFDLAANESEKDKQKTELVQDLQKKYELAGLADAEKEEKAVADEVAVLEKENIAKMEVLRNQIDIMLAQIKTALIKIQDDFSKREELSQIKTLIGELERVKMSNNIKHIKSVAERILEIAESLFKGKEEYKVVIKQKAEIKSIDLEKIQQVQQKQAAEIKGIAGVLDKASEFFKKYIGRTGIDKNKLVLDESLQKKMEKNQRMMSEVDLAQKNKEVLRSDFKKNLKLLLIAEDNQIKRKAWNDCKVILKNYFRRYKLETNQTEVKKSFWRSFFTARNPDLNKKDYQNIFIEINHFLGWLICFYVVYFVLGGLVLQKNLFLFKTFFYRTIFSEFLIVLFFALFIFQLLTIFKIKFFRQSFLGGTFLFLLGCFSVLLYSLNF